MDVDELSARLQRLAEDPDSGDPTVSSQNLEAEQQQQQGIVAPVSVASHVASAMPRPLTFDTRGNAGTALSMPPRALRSEVGPHVPAAPIVIEDDECEGKGGQEVEEGEHELEEMNAHHGGRIVGETHSRTTSGATLLHGYPHSSMRLFSLCYVCSPVVQSTLVKLTRHAICMYHQYPCIPWRG